MADGEPQPASPLRILIAEDEEALLEVTQEVLGRAGYAVVPAENGAVALERFAEAPESFALVILDFSMPVMDGAACLARMREIHPGVKVLLTSGHGHLQDTLDPSLLAGCLQKPYRLHEFMDAVRRILGG
jgi:two-component system, cell cycle sensor histidine kinase and response regulator CckA